MKPAILCGQNNKSCGEITIDFALHESAGPATRWALAASEGDVVGIVGPAAGGPKPAEFYILAGDETALSGIARILESIDKNATGFAFIEVDNPLEMQSLVKPSNIEIEWLYRHGAPAGTMMLLPEAIRSVFWPHNLNDVFFWGGCEHKAFREIHRILRQKVKLPSERQVLYSYWHKALSEEQIIAVGAEAYLPDS
jgi:NADPH-dependent ferric siderophore reductase